MTTPLGHKTTYTYDPFGDVLHTTDPNGNVTKNTYDADQNLATTTPKGDVTTNTYDADNELTKTVVTNPAKKTLSAQSTTYDAAGNVASSDQRGHQDDHVRLRPAEPQDLVDGPTWEDHQLHLRSGGNQLTVPTPRAGSPRRLMTPTTKPTSVTYSDGVTPDVTYAYDADGRRTSMTDGTGTTTYTYDSLGRLTADTQGGGQACNTATTWRRT